jgi:acyl-CoA synthetase (NDP forming)
MHTEWAAAGLLDRLGIARPDQRLVMSVAEAEAAAEELGGELVLKVQSAAIAHKSEVGGVRAGVRAEDAAEAYRELRADVGRAAPEAAVDGVLVQRQVPPGRELLVAVSGAEDGYPPVVTVGFGGVAAEVLEDVASALAPLGREHAHALLRRLRGWPLLAGHRGRPALDVEAAVAVLVSISEAAVELGPRLAELEINPLIVYERGACAVDALVRVS